MSNKMKYSVHIYLRNKRYYISPRSSTTTGLGIENGPITILEDDVSNEIFGKSVIDSTAFCKKNIPHPTNSAEWSQGMKEYLKMLKMRSYKAFVTGAELIAFYEKADETIRVLPWVNGGATGPTRGFTANYEKERILSAGFSAAELGEAIRKMFQDMVSKGD